MKKYLLFVVAAIATLVLVACGGKKIRVGVVLPDAKEERWMQQDGAFIKKELEALGKEYTFDILYSDGDEEKEKSNVEALIARGAEVIILTAHGSGAGAVEVAKAAKVPLIAHDRMAKSANNTADFYTTFNSWNVGKAQGQHLVDMAIAEGASEENKIDLAIYAGRTADWPNATYFFGGAMEALHPHMNKFNLINTANSTEVLAIAAAPLITEANFNDAGKTLLQAAMSKADTDWNTEIASTLAAATVASLQGKELTESVLVLAPNDDTSAAIRQEFAKLGTPYGKYFTTGQDASNVALASLMGDKDAGKGTQTMTVFKDTSKLSKDSVKIAKNILDGKNGLDGLTDGPKIDNVPTAYTPIDTLLASTPKETYKLIFATGFKDMNDPIFKNINFDDFK